MWKEISGYEGLYWISNDGHVKNAKQYVKKNVPDKNGYHKVWLSKESKKTPFFIHRLVGVAFLNNPDDKPIINHIDGIKDNNHESNLEWCTRSENDLHAFKLGLRKPTCGGTSKLIEQYSLSGELLATYKSMSHAFRETGISIQNISYCANDKQPQAMGFIWRFVKV